MDVEPKSGGVENDLEDPLDVFMGSIDRDILSIVQVGAEEADPANQAENLRIISHSSTNVIASKVAASPFCDILGNSRWRGRQRAVADARAGVPGATDGGADAQCAERACQKLLTTDPSSFLRRFGHVLSVEDLDMFPMLNDPQVALHVRRLKTLKTLNSHNTEVPTNNPSVTVGDGGADPDPNHQEVVHGGAGQMRFRDGQGPRPRTTLVPQEQGCPPAGMQARNRRYCRLNQLVEGGDWGSDQAMRERDPALWYDLVGRHAGEEPPAPPVPGGSADVPGNGGNVGSYLAETLGFLSKPSRGGQGISGRGGGSGGGGRDGRGSGVKNGTCTQLTGFLSASGGCGSADGDGINDDEAGAVKCTEERGEDMGGDMGGDKGTTHKNVTTSHNPCLSKDEKKTASQEHSSFQDLSTAIGGVHLTDNDKDKDATTVASMGDEGDGREEPDTKHTKNPDLERNVRGHQGVRGRNPEMRGVHWGDQGGQEGCDSDGDEDMGLHGGDGEDDRARISNRLCSEGKEEVLKLLSERFLAGLETGVDYAQLDGDDTLDDLDQLSRDQEERWFLRGHGEDEDDDIMT